MEISTSRRPCSSSQNVSSSSARLALPHEAIRRHAFPRSTVFCERAARAEAGPPRSNSGQLSPRGELGAYLVQPAGWSNVTKIMRGIRALRPVRLRRRPGGSPPDPELHLFVIWEHARPVADRILADIARRFGVLAGYEVEWSVQSDVRHFSRLYCQSLPPGCDKVAECGLGAFLLLVVRDPAPRYGRRRKWGQTTVTNTAMFDAKVRYRNWAGGARIHSSSDVSEADRDLFLLLGRRSADFAALPADNWDGRFERVVRDPLGTDGWRSLGDLLTATELTLPYVTLPQLEPQPNRICMLVKLATNDWGVEWTLAAPSEVPLDDRGPDYDVVLEGRPAVLELHHIGDESMPSEWQERLLADRIREGAGYVLPARHRLTALLHEAGPDPPPTALARLRKAAREAEAPETDLGDAQARSALLHSWASSPP